MLGLVDPLQLTALSLEFLVRQMLTSAREEDFLEWEIRSGALEKLAERTVERLPLREGLPRPQVVEDFDAHGAAGEDERDVPSMLSWPDVTWEEISRGVPTSTRLLGARRVLARRRLREDG